MKIYRFQKQKYATHESILSGQGAFLVGGRWNKRFTLLVYTSTTPELALLETLVHLEGTPYQDLPPMSLATLEIPDDSILEVKIKELPTNWQEIPAPLSTQLFTQPWLNEKKFLALKIHSVILPISFNVLLNPLHSRISNIKILDIQTFSFDSRLTTK